MFCQWLQACEFELFHHINETARAGIIGADEREQIAAHFNGITRVGEDDREQFLIDRALLAHFKMRNECAFFVG